MNKFITCNELYPKLADILGLPKERIKRFSLVLDGQFVVPEIKVTLHPSEGEMTEVIEEIKKYGIVEVMP